ncbi:MAG: sialate O-acetylesterase [Planctomycetia bacterium]|nr:sialate O-acetylesterase [Planctomycetia bacterium]
MLLQNSLLQNTSAARADVKLPNVLGSNMVLQRDRPVPIWGTAAADEEVTVSLGSHTEKTKAAADGKWQVKLPAMPANAEPQTLTVSGKNKLELKDILIGDVWVCSGQSNMQWAVAQANDGDKEIAAADHPQIRLFLVPLVQQAQPAPDVNAHWAACSPTTVRNFSAVGYFFGRKLHEEVKVPIGLISNAWGGRRIEPFTPPDAVKEIKELNDAPQGELGIIYNGMVAPLVPFAIRGVVWYQGESNNGEHLVYYQRMKALISGWRKIFDQPELPFYWVQIAPLANFYPNENLPHIWEAQTAALNIPHTGMAVITDIGNLGDIHPRNKQEAGRRLALWALAKDYGKTDLVYSGPLYKSSKVEGNKIRVQFAHAGDGLKSRDDKPLTEFEIAGPDGKFVAAKATIDGHDVIVEAESVTKPDRVRFGWRREANPNLTNAAGLPAGPFSSHDWRGGTGE